jgi:hypothetical protein
MKPKINQEEFLHIVKESRNAKVAFKTMHISRGTFDSYCKFYNVDTSHFKQGKEPIIITTTCKYCNSPIIQHKCKYMKMFCNSSCSGSYNDSRRKRNPWTTEQRTYVAKKMLPNITKEEFIEILQKTETKKDAAISLEITVKSLTSFCNIFNVSISDYFPKVLDHKRYHKPYTIKPRMKKIAETSEKQCIVCGTPFMDYLKGKKKLCSQICKNRFNSIRQSEYIRTHRSQIRGPHQQSYMEMSFENWLISNGYKKGIHGYLTEVHFYNPNTKKHGFADFVFPKLKIIIELDGTHHIKRAELDKLRDNYLNSRRWKVVRISQREYVKRTRIEEISNILNVGAPTRI